MPALSFKVMSPSGMPAFARPPPVLLSTFPKFPPAAQPFGALFFELGRNPGLSTLASDVEVGRPPTAAAWIRRQADIHRDLRSPGMCAHSIDDVPRCDDASRQRFATQRVDSRRWERCRLAAPHMCRRGQSRSPPQVRPRPAQDCPNSPRSRSRDRSELRGEIPSSAFARSFTVPFVRILIFLWSRKKIPMQNRK